MPTDTQRLVITMPGPMYRRVKRLARINMAQFVREAVAEKLATLDEVVSADVERGGWRGDSK